MVNKDEYINDGSCVAGLIALYKSTFTYLLTYLLCFYFYCVIINE